MRLEQADILDLLTSLVDKSLVVYDEAPAGGGRYRLLESVRQYAEEQLRTSGESEATFSRHVDFFTNLAEATEPELWVARLDVEYANLQGALGSCRSLERGVQQGLRLAPIFSYVAMHRGYSARPMLEEILARDASAAPTLARASTLNAIGTLAWVHGDYEAARTRSEESLAIRRCLGDKLGIVKSLRNLGGLADRQGDRATARALLAEGLAVAREIDSTNDIGEMSLRLGWLALNEGNIREARTRFEAAQESFRRQAAPEDMPRALDGLACVAREVGDLVSARKLQQEALALCRQRGPAWGVALFLYQLGRIAIAEGNLVEARDHLHRSLSSCAGVLAKADVLLLLTAAAELAVTKGEHHLSANVVAAVERLRREMDWHMGVDRRYYEQVRDAARTALGEDAFESAWSEGYALSYEQVVDSALHWLGREHGEADSRAT